MIQTFSSAYNIAVKCVEYLSSHVIEERALTVATAPSSRVNRWLESIDKGQVSNLFALYVHDFAWNLLQFVFLNFCSSLDPIVMSNAIIMHVMYM